MDLYPKNKIPISDVKKFIIIFNIVGVLGFAIPFSKNLFVTITPFALLLNFYLLVLYHNKYVFKDILIFLLIFLLGYTIEVIGVKSGLVFGHYTYGDALGLKLFETPILIGVNWLFLTYTATAISDILKIKKWLTLFAVPLYMLIYDIVLEQVAPKMDMWSWQNSYIPLKNYVAWYFVAFCFVLLLKIFKIETKNPLAAILLICQFVFFILLNIFL